MSYMFPYFPALQYEATCVESQAIF